MNTIKVATAQFEHKSGDKTYNLSRIESLAKSAASKGAQIILFHECSVSGYTFARHLSRAQMLDLAEEIPCGPSIDRLKQIATKYDIVVIAGLFEKDEDDNLYKTQICVNSGGVVAKFRKIHPFINPYLTPGKEFCVFELFGWKLGILICYDNNVIENVRATALLGADVIFMPHVTMCTPSPRPGAGFVDPKLWESKRKYPEILRQEFDGMKGRKWLMKWLPSRAYDNGVYVVFSNPIGMDDDQLRNGCSMILDPFGDIMTECRSLDDEFVMASFTHDKLMQAGGYRYRKARRPELYGQILSKPHKSEQKVSWLDPDLDLH
jgi:predicted amidohydrolase